MHSSGLLVLLHSYVHVFVGQPTYSCQPQTTASKSSDKSVVVSLKCLQSNPVLIKVTTARSTSTIAVSSLKAASAIPRIVYKLSWIR
ncbi:hypothetical protein C8Q74DRAFT_1225322, partial [Fomes fomentarius]